MNISALELVSLAGLVVKQHGTPDSNRDEIWAITGPKGALKQPEARPQSTTGHLSGFAGMSPEEQGRHLIEDHHIPASLVKGYRREVGGKTEVVGAYSRLHNGLHSNGGKLSVPRRFGLTAQGAEMDTPHLDKLVALAGGPRPGENMSQYADRVHPMHERGGLRSMSQIADSRTPASAEYPHKEAEVQRLTDRAMNSPRGLAMGGHRRLFEAEARMAVHSVTPGARARFHAMYGLEDEHSPGGRTRDYERVVHGREEHVSGHISRLREMAGPHALSNEDYARSLSDLVRGMDPTAADTVSGRINRAYEAHQRGLHRQASGHLASARDTAIYGGSARGLQRAIRAAMTHQDSLKDEF